MNFWPSAIGLRRMDDCPRPVRSLVARMPAFLRDAVWFRSPILRSAGVRFALIYAALLALSALALAVFLWWATAGLLDRQTEAAIRADAQGLSERWLDRKSVV